MDLIKFVLHTTIQLMLLLITISIIMPNLLMPKPEFDKVPYLVYPLLQLFYVLVHEFGHYLCAKIVNSKSKPVILSLTEFTCKNKEELTNTQIRLIALAGALMYIIIFTILFMIVSICFGKTGIILENKLLTSMYLIGNLGFTAQLIPMDKYCKIPTDGYWILYPLKWLQFK